jgi:hypothetical protein
VSAPGIAKYIDASYQTYGLLFDAVIDAGRSRRRYWNSIWELASRPRQAKALPSRVRESVDRAKAFVDLTAGELRSRGKKRAHFSGKLIATIAEPFVQA